MRKRREDLLTLQSGLYGFRLVVVILLAATALAQRLDKPVPTPQPRQQASILSRVTYIHEFPHPRVIVHYHPDDRQFLLEHAQFALDHEAHALELDLQYRKRDQAVVCNHESPTDESPTLNDVIRLLLYRK